jgi:hypothetical protein
MFRWGPDQFLRQPNFSASQISAPAKFQRQRTRFSAALLQVISIAISLKWVGRFLCSPASGDLYCDLTEVGCHGSLTQHWRRKLEFLPETSVKMRREQCQDAPRAVSRCAESSVCVFYRPRCRLGHMGPDLNPRVGPPPPPPPPSQNLSACHRHPY